MQPWEKRIMHPLIPHAFESFQPETQCFQPDAMLRYQKRSLARALPLADLAFVIPSQLFIVRAWSVLSNLRQQPFP